MIKKVIVTDFRSDGTIEFTSTMTFKTGIDEESSFESNKNSIKAILNKFMPKTGSYLVEWKNIYGDREGYLALESAKRNAED